jgi:hypothetical protein
MKTHVYILLLVINLAIIACCGKVGPQGPAGHSSIVLTQPIFAGNTVCPTGGSQIITALDANDDGLVQAAEIKSSSVVCNGLNGTDGLNGHNALVGAVSLSVSDPTCSNGGTLFLAGTDLNDDGVLQVGETSASFKVCNGVNGTNATVSPLTPTVAIAPCGKNSSPYKEVLLGMYDGSILASFSDDANGKNTRLVLITDGSFQDTDQSGCVFYVSSGTNARTLAWGYTWTPNTWLAR